MVRFFVVSRFLLRAALSVFVLASGDAFSRTVTYDLLWETGSGSFGDAALSPDGESIAVGGSVGIRLINVVDGILIRLFDNPTRSIAVLSFSPDGKTLVAGTDNNDVVLWNVETGRALHILTGHTDTISAVSFSNDGQKILSASYDGTVRIWDAVTGVQLRRIEAPFPVQSAKLSPHAQSIYMIAKNNSVPLLYHLDTGESYLKESDIGTADKITCDFVFTPDGSEIITTGGYPTKYDANSYIYRLNAQNGEYINRASGIYEIVHSTGFRPLAISSTGEFCLIGTIDGLVFVTERTHRGSYSYIKHYQFDRRITSLQFSMDGKRVLTVTNENEIVIWDFETGERIGEIPDYFHYPTQSFFSPDGRTYVTVYRDGEIELSDIDSLSTRTSIHTDNVGVAATLSRDGTKLATYISNGVVLWDAQTGQELRVIEHVTPKWLFIRNRAFSYDSQKLLFFYLESDEPYNWLASVSVSVYDLNSYERIAQYQSSMHPYDFPHIMPDCKTYVTDGFSMQKWNLLTGELLHTYNVKILPRPLIKSLISPDGKYCVSVDYGENFRFVNIEEDTSPYNPEFAGADFGYEFVFHPTEDQLVFCDARGGVLFWDFKEDREVKYFEGDFPKLKWLDISPDGERMFTLSADDTLRLWDLTTETGVGDWREY